MEAVDVIWILEKAKEILKSNKSFGICGAVEDAYILWADEGCQVPVGTLVQEVSVFYIVPEFNRYRPESSISDLMFWWNPLNKSIRYEVLDGLIATYKLKRDEKKRIPNESSIINSRGMSDTEDRSDCISGI